ncbi:hypothetical protein D3C79_740320 [compost metagenome]
MVSFFQLSQNLLQATLQHNFDLGGSEADCEFVQCLFNYEEFAFFFDVYVCRDLEKLGQGLVVWGVNMNAVVEVCVLACLTTNFAVKKQEQCLFCKELAGGFAVSLVNV